MNTGKNEHSETIFQSTTLACYANYMIYVLHVTFLRIIKQSNNIGFKICNCHLFIKVIY